MFFHIINNINELSYTILKITLPIIRYNKKPKKFIPIMLNEDKVINIARITYVTFNIVSNNKFLKLRKSLNHTRNLLSNLLFLLINKT